MTTPIQNRLTVAFDIDSTLIDEHDRPIHDNLFLLLLFAKMGVDLIVWSGGGVSYAEHHARRLGIDDKVRVIPKGSEPVDVAFDDQPVQLGTVNFLLSR